MKSLLSTLFILSLPLRAIAATQLLGMLSPASKRKASRWVVHFLDRDPLVAAFSPAATHGQVLASYRDAVAAEPVVSPR